MEEKKKRKERLERGGVEIHSPYGFIYITTNLINGKRYIGQKKYDTASRWKSYMGSGYHLLASIEKHGKENFERVIVDWAYSLEELNQKEYDMIKNLGAVESDDYYNMIDGGDVASNLAKRNSVPVVMISTRKIFDSILDGADYCGVGEGSIRLRMERSHTFKLVNEIPVFRKLEDVSNIDNLCSVCGEEFEYLLYRDSLIKLPRCSHCDIEITQQEQSELRMGRISQHGLNKLGVAERKLCRELDDSRQRGYLYGDFLTCIDKGLSIKQSLKTCGIVSTPRIVKQVLDMERPQWKAARYYYMAFEDKKPVYSCQYPKDFIQWLNRYVGATHLSLLNLNLAVLHDVEVNGVEIRIVDSEGYQQFIKDNEYI